ncbi:MAG: hypothetical protein RJB66_1752 [Pseudomonadota bacterium]|jgi:hypothetical protein
MASHHSEQLHASNYSPSSGAKTAATVAAAVGALAFAVGVFKFQDRAWPAFLLAFFYFTALALGGLFFCAIQSVTNAGWSASIRRIAESLTSFVPFILVGGLILTFGLKQLYPWADAEQMATDALLQAKKAYLNVPFFLIRMFGFGLLMWLFRQQIVGRSLTQDKTKDDKLTFGAIPWSIAFLLVFSLGFSLFSVDLLMALLPHWYSTIWGVYCFAGLIQAFFAFMILLTFAIKKSGAVKGYITTEHFHDLGKFLKGFTVFWAYIAFSQYMLIWYANIPEETEFFLLRAQNGWLAISLGLLIFRFIVPFLILLPRGAKRSEGTLKGVSWLVLVMQFVDLYWIIYPNFHENHVSFGPLEACIFAGVAGVFMLSVFKFFAKNSPVAVQDPRMHEALNHHVTY